MGYEVFDGNRRDVTTLEDMVMLMEDKYGKAKRVWVLDRGFASEENLDFLRGREAQYIGSSWFGVGKNEWAVSRNRLLGIEMKGVVMAEKLVMIPGCKKPDGCRMNIDSPDFVHKRP